MIRIALFLTLILSLSACGDRGFGLGRDRVAFDGQNYRGAVRTERRDRINFTASVRPVSASLDGAILAAEYEGIKHCIKFFGTSRIDWSVGPETDRAALPIDGDTLIFTGRCVE